MNSHGPNWNQKKLLRVWIELCRIIRLASISVALITSFDEMNLNERFGRDSCSLPLIDLDWLMKNAILWWFSVRLISNLHSQASRVPHSGFIPFRTLGRNIMWKNVTLLELKRHRTWLKARHILSTDFFCVCLRPLFAYVISHSICWTHSKCLDSHDCANITHQLLLCLCRVHACGI